MRLRKIIAIKPRRNSGNEAKRNDGNKAKGSSFYEQLIMLEKKKIWQR